MTKAELQSSLAAAAQTDNKTAGVFLDALSAIACKGAKKKSRPVKKVESAKSTPEENFTKLIELHKAKGPVPFRPTQRDYKRQEKLVSVDSLSEIAFDDGLFKDEADLNGFVRWILRCQAKRESGTFEP